MCCTEYGKRPDGGVTSADVAADRASVAVLWFPKWLGARPAT